MIALLAALASPWPPIGALGHEPPAIIVPHDMTAAEAAMALADLYGIHVEPVIEADATLCARQVPIWHAGADWSYCSQGVALAEDPKRPTLAPETWALLGAPGGLGLPAAWAVPARRGASSTVIGPGAVAIYGGDGTETARETREVVTVPERTTCCGHCVICPLPPDEPPDVPAPVPLPGSGWLLAGLLGLLFTRRN